MIRLTGRDLSLEDVLRVAAGPGVTVSLALEAEEAMGRARAFVEAAVAGGTAVYGVTTGFGRLAEVVISPAEQGRLQLNLVRSHAAGVGSPLSVPAVRAMMLLRANALARGHSGCRIEVVRRLVDFLNLGVHPWVPSVGSVGASGDLAPLAHVALCVLGEGYVVDEGGRRPTRDILAEHGLEPLELEAKEGLSLINGTQATTALGILALLSAESAVEAAECAGALSLEALKGTPEAFREEVSRVRPHLGQARSARRLRALLADSEIRESHRHGDPRVQDAYALRCMPQVHGATRDVLTYVRGVLETEANSVTDNPLIFPEEGVVVSAGNFHAQVVAQGLDFLCIAAADLASISERRTERMLNPDLSGLPAFLADSPGLESGLMIAQVTAVDLLAELRVLAHPASVDSVPTSANQEDHVSMGLAAARKVQRAVECLRYVLAVELLCGARALEYRRPLRAGTGVERAYARIREAVPAVAGDHPLSDEIEALQALVARGAFTPGELDAEAGEPRSAPSGAPEPEGT
ncbi:MAG TPA: histidine ammonia-lyase [Longimicrobiales bacterium]|jgi:histidine ammonia-lyase